MVFWTFIFSLAAEDKARNGRCDFDSYRPLKIGAPIRGGHEGLAVKTVNPTYPEEARRKGVTGRVDAQVLVNRKGDVIKVCAVGEGLLIRPIEEAVLKWKFQKDFGLTFNGPSPSQPRYAVLRLSFNFKPTDTVDTNRSTSAWDCPGDRSTALDDQGRRIWLHTDELMQRVVKKTNLTFPMLDGGHLRGTVELDVLIDATGNLECVQAVSGNPIAIASAMAAIQNWKFEAFVLWNKRLPVLGHLSIPYDSHR